jgi:DNA recombination protein RmuC
MEILLLVVGLLAGALAGLLAGLRLAGRLRGRQADPAVAELAARAEDQAVIRAGLDRLAERMQDLEHQRVSWQSQLRQQVDEVRHSTDTLRRETGVLATALRRPHVRGQWGELHLRRCVEAAGMAAHCDFTEQVHVAGDERAVRPDLVVHLAGGRDVVVDAKTPLEAYLDALAAPDDEQEQLLVRHARALRGHVDTLAAKGYRTALPSAPEFVVLFVPSESCLSAALGVEPGLIEYAAARDVVLASPTTLIALLRAVAHGWTTRAVVEATREIHELGRELHGRLATMGGHLAKLGRALGAAVESYNATIGSVESRVLVTARQFEDIGVGRARLETPPAVEAAPRPLSAAELLDAATPSRDPLDDPLDTRLDGRPATRRGDDDAAGPRSSLGA